MLSCLVVDDSRVIRKLASRILADLRMEVREAENGAVALELCAQAMPDVIVVDWNMPVLDGIQFVKRLRASAHGDRPKVLFCTTESELAKIAEAIEHGAYEYIMKPFDKDIMMSKLQRVGAI